VRDIALDPLTGDLDLSTGGLRLTEIGAESIAQRLRIRLQLWLGEYLLDVRAGIPFQRLLGSKDDGPDGLEATLRAAVTTCPGILALETWSYELTAQREAIVSFVARMTDGDPVEVGAFTIGAA
jgi:hypothetical protein